MLEQLGIDPYKVAADIASASPVTGETLTPGADVGAFAGRVTDPATAGVAQSTVSRYFRDDSGISDDTRSRVHAIAVQLGYTPNAVARSLILRRSNVVALIVTKFTLRTNPYVIHGISQALVGADKRLLLMKVAGDHDVADAVRGAMEYPIDGLITGALISDDDLRRFLARGVPVVFLNRRMDRPWVDCVTTDHRTATEELVEMLHAAGFRDFLCMTGPSASAANVERVSGFRDRMEVLGGTRIEMYGSGFSCGACRFPRRRPGPCCCRALSNGAGLPG